MKKVLFLCFILLRVESYSQNSSFQYQFQTPPSPNATSLGKYGEIEVDLYNGLPNINLPIYSLKARDLSLDISLSYHAGGIRVDEDASWVGLGWSLNAGGVITRVVKDKPDEIGSNCPKDPDVFYYNFLGNSGKFIIDPSSGAFLKINQNNLLITTITNNFIDGFLIKLEDGTKLFFNIKEYQDNTIYQNNTSFTETYLTAWYLSKIESSKGDVINFEYSEEYAVNRDFYAYTDFYTTARSVSSYRNESGGLLITNCYTLPELGLAGQDPNVQPLIINHTKITYKTKYLKTIVFNNGSIDFNISDREDLTNTNNTVKGKKLDNIIVKSNGRTIKKSVFEYSYFNNSNNSILSKRLKLLECKDINLSNGLALNGYSFSYNSMSLPDKNSFDQDHWGFYNGPKNNSNIPSNRNNIPDSSYAKAASLERVTYPTGGFTIFYMGSNDFINRTTGNLYVGGGLRINSINNYTSEGLIASRKRFEYKKMNQSNQPVSSGKLIGAALRSFYYENNHSYPANPYAKYLNKKDESCSISGPQYLYYINYSSTNLATSSSNTLPLGEYSGNGNPVCYEKITEFNDEGGESGKVEYEYKNDYATPDLSNSFTYPPNMPQTAPFTNGQLLKQVYFKRNGNNYEKLKEVKYEYLSKNPITISAQRITVFGNIIQQCGTRKTYNIYSDWNVLSGEVVKTYHNNSVLIDSVAYNYDNPSHKKITSITRQSDGLTEYELIKYPIDFQNDATYSGMLQQNIISPVIEQHKYRNGDIVSKTKIKYEQSNGNYNPTEEYAQVSNNPLEKVFEYSYYNSGKVKDQNKVNDIKKAAIWDYNNSLLIAEINNSSASDVAYTSFESDGIGGWGFGSHAISMINGNITGKKSYNLGAGMWKNDLNANVKYTLSLWVKGPKPGFNIHYPNSSGSIIDNQLILIKSISGWDLYQGEFENAVGIGIWKYQDRAISFIDEVKLYPSKSQMTTFTYDPLIGITASCDINNNILYYQYDANGRLRYIRDEENNILKKFCYNYSGQTEDCQELTYWNTQLSQTFTKNDCPSGYVGSEVIYSVPANTYSSTVSQDEANALAQAAINEKGQDHTNQNANCILISTCNWNSCDSQGPQYKCVYGTCESGLKIYTDSYYDFWTDQYVCVYHYEWSDGSWSQDYEEYNYGGFACFTMDSF